jgi:hypothetical protein
VEVDTIGRLEDDTIGGKIAGRFGITGAEDVDLVVGVLLRLVDFGLVDFGLGQCLLVDAGPPFLIRHHDIGCCGMAAEEGRKGDESSQWCFAAGNVCSAIPCRMIATAH